MVQGRIGNDANAALSSLLRQTLEVGIGTKGGINFMKVGGVVLVIAGSLEHWGHVNGIGTQIFDVIQFLNDAF